MLLDRRILLRRAGLSAAGLLLLMRTARAAAAQVTIDNFAFKPNMLTVAAGTSVTWTNHDDIPHSIVCPALGLHSHALDTDQSFTATFAKAGVYDYNCGLHPHMKGRIVLS